MWRPRSTFRLGRMVRSVATGESRLWRHRLSWVWQNPACAILIRLRALDSQWNRVSCMTYNSFVSASENRLPTFAYLELDYWLRIQYTAHFLRIIVDIIQRILTILWSVVPSILAPAPRIMRPVLRHLHSHFRQMLSERVAVLPDRGIRRRISCLVRLKPQDSVQQSSGADPWNQKIRHWIGLLHWVRVPISWFEYQSVGTRNQCSGPIKWRIFWFHGSAPLVSQSN